jgi:hypothetical protein
MCALINVHFIHLQGEELTKMTGAFVMIYTARSVIVLPLETYFNCVPRFESIEDGKDRVFSSVGLDITDSDIEERISAVKKEIKSIAVEIARRTCPRSSKRRRVDSNTPRSSNKDVVNVVHVKPMDVLSSGVLSKGKASQQAPMRSTPSRGNHQASGPSDHPSGIQDGLLEGRHTSANASQAKARPRALSRSVSNSEIYTIMSLL